MKRILLSFVLISTYLFSVAQANVTSTAISVQGIARNDQSNAVLNSTLPIVATLYYIDGSSNLQTILTRSGNITTDAFGVFAYVLDIASSDFVKISNTQAWIKIASNNVVFAQEKLMTVPYAVHAQNGVPTGAIMPYAGSTAPDGWMLADGSAIPAGDYYAALRAIFGTNVPNLNGMFLRGAGSQTVNSVSVGGNTLKGTQNQEVGSHAHAQQGTFTSTTAGNHDHNYYTQSGGNIVRGTGAGQVDPARGSVRADPERPAGGSDDFALFTSATGDHNHTITLSGNTANNSGTDNRPVNYGVNYIIKI